MFEKSKKELDEELVKLAKELEENTRKQRDAIVALNAMKLANKQEEVSKLSEEALTIKHEEKQEEKKVDMEAIRKRRQERKARAQRQKELEALQKDVEEKKIAAEKARAVSQEKFDKLKKLQAEIKSNAEKREAQRAELREKIEAKKAHIALMREGLAKKEAKKIEAEQKELERLQKEKALLYDINIKKFDSLLLMDKENEKLENATKKTHNHVQKRAYTTDDIETRRATFNIEEFKKNIAALKKSQVELAIKKMLADRRQESKVCKLAETRKVMEELSDENTFLGMSKETFSNVYSCIESSYLTTVNFLYTFANLGQEASPAAQAVIF